jgi:8-oxo-dGTP diphosphatase
MKHKKAQFSSKFLERWHQIALWCAFQVLRFWWFIRRPSHHGALLLIWFESQVLLVRNSYQPYWSSPGGSVEKGESPLNAVVRECEEEIGLQINANEVVLVQESTLRFRFRSDKVSIFEWHALDRPNIKLDFREIIEAKWLDFNDARQLDLVPHLSEYFERLVLISNCEAVYVPIELGGSSAKRQ